MCAAIDILERRYRKFLPALVVTVICVIVMSLTSTDDFVVGIETNIDDVVGGAFTPLKIATRTIKVL